MAQMARESPSCVLSPVSTPGFLQDGETRRQGEWARRGISMLFGFICAMFIFGVEGVTLQT